MEKVTVYADFFSYKTGTFPICVDDKYSVFSGLKINWGKSQILPLDFIPPVDQDRLLPLQWVNKLKYLSIQVTKNVAHLIQSNLFKALATFKSQFKGLEALAPISFWQD